MKNVPYLSRTSGLTACAALLLASACVPVRAADLYVSPQGSDSNPGTSPEKPLQTLQKADALVAPGDTVYVMAGTYRNTGSDKGGGSSALLRLTHSGTPEKWVTWRAYKDDKPELVAQGCWQCIDVQASYVAIEGLTLTGNNDNVRLADAERNAEVNVKATYAAWRAEGSMDAADFSATPNLDKPGTAPVPKAPAKPAAKAKSRPVTYEEPSPLYNGNGITVDCRGKKPFVHHIRLKNLTVRKFGTGGIALMSTDYYTVEGCEVYDNSWYSRYGGSGISQLGGKAFDEKPGYHNVIRNNRVYNNKGLVRVYYLGLGLISDGNGIILDSLGDYPGGVLVENNLSYGNGGAGIHVFKSRKARIDIVNNTVWGNQQNWKLYDMGAHDATGVTFLNNVVVADRYRQVNGKSAPGITYDYNVYWGSTLIDAKGPNDLVADPLFAVPTTNRRDGDFRLLPGSPARGTGAKTEITPAADMTGKPRGEKPTRGAYEG
jgi:hypothetical protein